MNHPQAVILHHSGGTDSNPVADSSNYTFLQCNSDHKVRFNFVSKMGLYCGYHYFIAKDGMITQARYEDEEGAHTIGMNNRSIGVCLAGNFDVTRPTEAQKQAFRILYTKLQLRYPRILVHPHNRYAKKTCPGEYGDVFIKELLVEQLSLLQRLLHMLKLR